MKIQGAMTILAKKAKSLNMSIEETIKVIDSNPTAYPLRVIQAYEVYMKDKGYVWSGVNYQRWVMEKECM